MAIVKRNRHEGGHIIRKWVSHDWQNQVIALVLDLARQAFGEREITSVVQRIVSKRVDKLVSLIHFATAMDYDDRTNEPAHAKDSAPFSVDDGAALIVWPVRRANALARKLFDKRTVEIFEDGAINMDWFDFKQTA